MANTYGIFNNGTVVLEYWNGVVDVGELIEHETSQLNDTLIKNLAVFLVDCRDVDFEMDFKSIEKFIGIYDTFNKKLKSMAVLINKSGWDITNEYSHQAWTAGFEVITFFDLESACIWLDLDHKNTQHRIQALKKSVILDVS